MASSKIKGITIEIGGNTTKLQDALKGVDKQVYSLNGDLKSLNQALKLDPKNTELLSQKQEVLSRNIAASKEKLETLVEAQRQMGDYNKLTDEQKSSYNQLSLEIAKSENALKNLNEELKETNKAKLDGLKESLIKVGNVAANISKAVVGIGAGIIAASVASAKALFNAAKETSKYGDEVDKASQKLNISAENYQKLSYAMEMNGASINDVSKGMKTIVSDLGKMSNGVSKANDKYKRLGISLKDSNGNLKSSQQVLFDSIDALAKMQNQTKRNAMAQEIFGKSAAELTPLLNSGSKGIKQLMQEAEDYGMVMSDKAVKASADFDDSLTRLKNTFSGLKNRMTGELLPGISKIMDGLSGLISGTDKSGKKIKEGIESVAKVIQQILPTIVDSIANMIPTLLPIINDIILTISKTIIKNLPTIIRAGIDVLMALIKGIVDAIPDLIPVMVDCILTMVDALLENIDLLIEAGIKLMKGIFEGLIKAIPNLILKVPEIIVKIADEFAKGAEDMYDVGKKLIEGLWDGMKAKWNYYKMKGGGSGLAGFALQIVEDIAALFGIHSPSTVMRDRIGKNLGLGIAVGINDTAKDVEEAMSNLASGVEASVNPTINPTANSNPLYITIDKFYNNRDTDIQQLAEELEFYRRNNALAKGGV